MLERARADGLIDETADLDWTRRVYYALLGEALRDSAEGAEGSDPDTLAARVIDTLLHGAGPHA
ncbi:hypothetical protein [Streptomyces sp. NBRC 109706]|uniref:hypothetical protein n=1 Tax=Streptomyces sp. NBRC 109706 TaxID=1550035 RepID=UPI000AFF4DC9|nr:hypothetical protein [Streptomyces sp. NBRC 109706]